ncbi:MAG TPA: lytic transglycosylase domain-containing protein [Acidobacteriaceae bacterium]|jgi:soluble lytic murein transglycosylase-like protein|nr:lytic transglycosylase domain-containing protein [Acidobacteriaceae bacterium]
MPRLTPKFWSRTPVLAVAILCLGAPLWAAGPDAGHLAEHITLKNGFDLICDHRAADGGKVRLYLDAAGTNFMEVNAADIASDEPVTLSAPASAVKPATLPAPAATEKLTDAELRPMLATAGETYDIDADLLASVVRQESGGHARAVSRTGAQGLMQLMPETASEVGVANSFAPSQNIRGGTAYLDALLRKYHDSLPLALAAYNAGPGAVDRWHGIPPYRETRAYVARVIHEYNRRYALRSRAAAAASAQVAALPR